MGEVPVGGGEGEDEVAEGVVLIDPPEREE